MLRSVLSLTIIIAAVYACSDEKSSCPGWKILCKTNQAVRNLCKKTCGICKDEKKEKEEKCGISKVPNVEAVTSANAPPGAWPWVVSLQTTWGYQFCGGSIVSPNLIMTAATCLITRKDTPAKIMVVAGAHDIKEKSEHEQKIIAKSIIRHPAYDYDKRGSHNIALIELSEPLKMNDHVMSVCMPKQYTRPKVGDTCIYLGWGVPHQTSTTKLQQVPLSILKNKRYLGYQYIYGKYQQSDKPSIAYGNPLVCQRADKTWQIDGVSNYRNSYSQYIAFSEVNTILKWLEEKEDKYL